MGRAFRGLRTSLVQDPGRTYDKYGEQLIMITSGRPRVCHFLLVAINETQDALLNMFREGTGRLILKGQECSIPKLWMLCRRNQLGASGNASGPPGAHPERC